MNRLRALIFSMSGGPDPDAAAFITAAGITDATQQAAIKTLVAALKNNSLWTKMQAIYPFVGGSSSSHSYNLKNTATFQITWNGTVTHNANGVTGNGSTGYGDTGFNPSTQSSTNDASIGVYSRSTGTSVSSEIGAAASTTSYTKIFCKYTDNLAYGEMWATGSGSGEISGSVTNSQGLFTITRRSSSDCEFYRNATTIGNTTGTGGGSPPNKNVYICASNDLSGATAFSTRNIAFAFIGKGLTDTDVSNLYTAIQNFQTTLSRQV